MRTLQWPGSCEKRTADDWRPIDPADHGLRRSHTPQFNAYPTCAIKPEAPVTLGLPAVPRQGLEPRTYRLRVQAIPVLGVREARRASEINVSDPPKLDEEILARIRSIHRDYFERWTLLPVGGTLDLRFRARRGIPAAAGSLAPGAPAAPNDRCRGSDALLASRE